MTTPGKIWVLFVLAAGLSASRMAAQPDATGHTLDDRVNFSAPASWLMTERPGGMAFKIRNPGEDWHANLPLLAIYDRDLRTLRESSDFQEEGTRNVRNFQRREIAASWECRTWLVQSVSTQKVSWDCRRINADLGVAVDLVWPRLGKNPPDYDAQMEELLSSFLEGVSFR